MDNNKLKEYLILGASIGFTLASLNIYNIKYSPEILYFKNEEKYSGRELCESNDKRIHIIKRKLILISILKGVSISLFYPCVLFDIVFNGFKELEKYIIP